MEQSKQKPKVKITTAIIVVLITAAIGFLSSLYFVNRAEETENIAAEAATKENMMNSINANQKLIIILTERLTAEKTYQQTMFDSHRKTHDIIDYNYKEMKARDCRQDEIIGGLETRTSVLEVKINK